MQNFWNTKFGKVFNVLTGFVPKLVYNWLVGDTYDDGSQSGVLGIFNKNNWNNMKQDTKEGVNNAVSNTLGLDSENPLGDLFKSLANRITASHLTGAEQEANAFSAEQAQINRDFEERMANTQYQRGVADMRAAGVNPALAMSQGGAAAPSGNAASSVQPQSQGFNMSDLMHLLLIGKQSKLLDAQAANINADTEKKGAETGLLTQQSSVFDKITEAQLKDIESRIAQRDVQNALSRQGISESEARQALLVQQTIVSKIAADYQARLNDAQLKYQDALTSYTNRKSSESEALVKKYAAEIDGIYQQAILHASQAGYFTQAEENLLKQAGIIDFQAQEHQFTVDHQKADRNWRIASTVFGMVKDTAVAAGSVAMGAGSLARSGILAGTTVSASPWSFHNTGGYNWIGF